MRPLFIILVTIMVLAPIHARAVTTIALINEDFSTGTGNVSGTTTWSHNGLNWVWSSVTGSVAPSWTEAYRGSLSLARGMPSTHGGFEVFSGASSEPVAGSIWQVAVSVVLPTNYPVVWDGNTISFDMGYRTAISSSSAFYLVNITDNRVITSSAITGSVGSWKNYAFNPVFTSADAGDTVQLIWKDTASAGTPLASGLEVGAVVFNVVPEPSALSLLAVGLGGLAMMRRCRS